MPVVARSDRLARGRAPTAGAPVEVQLTAASRPPARTGDVRLNVAWLVLIVFGLGTLLATTIRSRHGSPATSTLVVALFGLTVGALVWAALETRWSSRRDA
jgi:hypothetical protein